MKVKKALFPDGDSALFVGLFHIKSWIDGIKVLCIQFVLHHAKSLAKALEMDDFPLPQEFNYITHIRVITQSQDVVIGYPCLLLCQGVP